VTWGGDIAEASEAFHLAHQERYGHRLELPVELVNLRLQLRGPTPELPICAVEEAGESIVPDLGVLHGIDGPVEIFQREKLRLGDVIEGPALVTEQVSTTFIAADWRGMVDGVGNLVLEFVG